MKSLSRHVESLRINSVVREISFALLAALLPCMCPASHCTGQEINDDFSKPNLESRVAERGEWKFENNIATCVSDREFYKKYKNHGPIIKWSSESGFTDCTTEFEFKPDQCQRVVFTFNGDGHIFRLSLLDPAKTPGSKKAASRLIGWASKSSKESKGDSMKPKGLPSLADLNGKWVKLKAVVSGDSVDLTIGEFNTNFKHASLARDKNLTTLSFARGSMSVRNFQFNGSSDSGQSPKATSKEPTTYSVKEIQPIQSLPDELRTKTKSLNYKYAVHAPDSDHTKKLPLVIFLHGAGANGEGDEIKRFQPGRFGLVKHMKRVGQVPCYYVVPQCSRGKKPERGIWRADDLDVLLGHLKDTLPIDADRVYLTGTSMGGYGTWCWAAASPESFAAVVPVCGGTGPGGPRDVTKDLDDWAKSLTRVPLWAFHGKDDSIVPFSRSKDMVDLIKKHGGENVKLTGYPGVRHNAGEAAFADPELYKWLFKQKREPKKQAAEK